MSQQEYEAGALEEAHYFQTLSEVAELMHTHGTRQVLLDLLDLLELSIERDLLGTIN
jgi:hypothetical protein